MNSSKIVLATLIFLLSISNVLCQKHVLSQKFIDAESNIDSLFRSNFYRLETYKQEFKLKNPGFSMTEFYEPENKEVYKFVDLLVKLSGINCDSTIYQEGWNHEYGTWNDEKVSEWEIWYNKNANQLNYQKVLKQKRIIDLNWDNK